MGAGFQSTARLAYSYGRASESVHARVSPACLVGERPGGAGSKSKAGKLRGQPVASSRRRRPAALALALAPRAGGWLAVGASGGGGGTSHPEKQKRVPTGGGRSKSGVSVGVGGPRPRWRKRALLWIARLGSCIDRQAGRPGQGAAGTLLHYTAQPARAAGIGPAGWRCRCARVVSGGGVEGKQASTCTRRVWRPRSVPL